MNGDRQWLVMSAVVDVLTATAPSAPIVSIPLGILGWQSKRIGYG